MSSLDTVCTGETESVPGMAMRDPVMTTSSKVSGLAVAAPASWPATVATPANAAIIARLASDRWLIIEFVSQCWMVWVGSRVAPSDLAGTLHFGYLATQQSRRRPRGHRTRLHRCKLTTGRTAIQSNARWVLGKIDDLQVKFWREIKEHLCQGSHVAGKSLLV